MVDDYNFAGDTFYVDYNSDYNTCPGWMNTKPTYGKMNVMNPNKTGQNNLERYKPAYSEQYKSAYDENYKPAYSEQYKGAYSENYKPAYSERYQSQNNIYDSTRDMQGLPTAPYIQPFPSNQSLNNPYNNPSWMFSNSPSIPSETNWLKNNGQSAPYYNQPGILKGEHFQIIPTMPFQYESFGANEMLFMFFIFVIFLALALILKRMYDIDNKLEMMNIMKKT